MRKPLLIPAISLTVLLAALSLTAGANDSKSAGVTFSKDVAPLLYSNCAECHRPTGIAPMALITYKDVRPWAKSVKQRVAERSMPPWFADPNHGEFSNNPSLSQKAIDTIVSWVDNGAPKGDDKDLPVVPKFVEGWTIGQPDVVLSMSEEYLVPADGVVPYLYFTIPTNFTEDRWIQAFEIKPGDKRVVHHVIAYLEDGKTPRSAQGQGPQGQRGAALGGITPNKTGVVLPPGTARLVKAGTNIVLQMHYTTIGEASKDRTTVGLIFAKQPPKRVAGGGNALNARFVIPPGDGNYQVKSSTTFKEDTYLTAMMPHMHVRGKDFMYTVVYPDGKSEVVLNVPRYDFNWQLTYELKKPIFLPKGSRLDCVAHFDNSTKNKFNPDPSKEVRWGPQTWEEMMIGWYSTIRHLNPTDKPDVAAR
jgi:hypothetical protein